jgi:hypothetical protein
VRFCPSKKCWANWPNAVRDRVNEKKVKKSFPFYHANRLMVNVYLTLRVVPFTMENLLIKKELQLVGPCSNSTSFYFLEKTYTILILEECAIHQFSTFFNPLFHQRL